MLCLPKTNMLTAKVADAACPCDGWKADKIQIVPHPRVTFIIQTGYQLSADEHSRKPGKGSDLKNIFLLRSKWLKCCGDHGDNCANMSSWVFV